MASQRKFNVNIIFIKTYRDSDGYSQVDYLRPSPPEYAQEVMGIGLNAIGLYPHTIVEAYDNGFKVVAAAMPRSMWKCVRNIIEPMNFETRVAVQNHEPVEFDITVLKVAD